MWNGNLLKLDWNLLKMETQVKVSYLQLSKKVLSKDCYLTIVINNFESKVSIRKFNLSFYCYKSVIYAHLCLCLLKVLDFLSFYFAFNFSEISFCMYNVPFQIHFLFIFSQGYWMMYTENVYLVIVIFCSLILRIWNEIR